MHRSMTDHVQRFFLSRVVIWTTIVCLILSSFFQVRPVQANTVTILNVEHQEVNFNNEVLVSGTANLAGARYKYANIFTKDGISVDAYITVENIQNAYYNPFDDTADGVAARFQPKIGTNTNAGGSIQFRFDFVLHSNDVDVTADLSNSTRVYLYNFYLTAIDIDGGTEKEFVEISGYSKYIVDASSALTVTASDAGRTRFRGGPDASGVAFKNENSFIADYTAPISSMTVVLGYEGKTSQDRQYSVNFGMPGGTFSNAVQHVNLNKPVIDVDVTDSSDLEAVVIAGETTAEPGQTVTILAEDEEGNSRTCSATVTAGVGTNTYTASCDLSALEPGEVTITASVVNQYGNPADPATTTFTIPAVAVAITSPGNGDVVTATPTVTGTTNDAGNTVKLTIRNSSNQPIAGLTDVTATMNGTAWNYTVGAGNKLPEGSYTVTATATDASNQSATATVGFTVDDTIAVTISTPENGDTVTATPTVTGTTDDAGNTVKLTFRDSGNQPIAGLTDVTATMNGTAWSYTVGAANKLSEGSYTVTATATDEAGNSASDSAGFTVDDTIAVTITAPENGDTVKATPTVTGTTDDAGNTVKLTFYDDMGDPIAGLTDVTATMNGTTWSYTVGDANKLSEGSYTVTATVTDEAGNSASDTAGFSVDTTITVTITTPENGDTVKATPTVTGTTDDAGNTVKLTFYDDMGDPIAGLTDVTATLNGTAWTYTVGDANKLSEGSYTVTATATDEAGNSASDSAGFTVDDTIAVTITAPENGDTVKATPTVTGTTDDAGNTVKLTFRDSGNQPIAGLTDVTATMNGTAWTYTVGAANKLSEGSYTVTATATDEAGNSASESAGFTVDDTIAVTITAPENGDAVKATLTVTGTTDDAGNTVKLTFHDDMGDPIAGLTNVTVTMNGTSWSYTVGDANKLSEGSYSVTATATDEAGNSASDTAGFTVDTTIAVNIVSPANNALTNDDTPVVSGTTDDASNTLALTVKDSDGNTVVGPDAVTVDVDGSWSFDIEDELADGMYTVTVKATDEADNTAEDTHTITVDTTVEVDIASPAHGATTNDTTPKVEGTTDDAGNTVTLTIEDGAGNAVVGPDAAVTVDSDGDWSFTVNDALPDGAYTVKVKATDEAGNTATDTHTFAINTLDGWTGSRAWNDSTPVVVSPGDPLKLSATASVLADAVEVEVVPGEPAVQLVKKGVENGYSIWENVSWRLPDNLTSGTYSIEVTAYANGQPLAAEPADRLGNNTYHVVAEIDLAGRVTEADSQDPIEGAEVALYDPTGTRPVLDDDGEPLVVLTDANGEYVFDNLRTRNYRIVVRKAGFSTVERVISTTPATPTQTVVTSDFELVDFTLTLTANPTSIVGDGNSTTRLTAVITDKDGRPIPNIDVEFDAPIGTFLGGDTTVKTDANGRATIQYRSVQIEGILSQNIPVTATVNDPVNRLFDTKVIYITFEPARIEGVVTTMNVPVEGAVVKLTKDFDGDGIIDFAAEAVTGPDGKYSIAVPRGNTVYDLEITKPIMIAGESKSVTFRQKADVNQPITGTGQTFESTQAATGLLLMRDPEGNNAQFAAAQLNAFRVYLRDSATGDYLVNPDTGDDWFTLSGEGVFYAENLDPAKEYQLEIKYLIEIVDVNHPKFGQTVEIIFNQKVVLDGDGKPVLDPDGQRMVEYPVVRLTENGELNILEHLVDPYGDVRDQNTNALIEGVTVTLYYSANDKKVTLPAIPGFEPFDNASPSQTTGPEGKYAWMVYPETDYYLIAEKAGYQTYRSPNIRVDWDIVRHDIWLKPIVNNVPVFIPIPDDPEPEAAGGTDLVVNLEVGTSRVEEGSDIPVRVVFGNRGEEPLEGGTVTVTLPAGAIVVDAGGGTVDGNTLVWTVDLQPGETGERRIVIRFPDQNEAEVQIVIDAAIAAKGAEQPAESGRATVKLMTFSNRFGPVEHTRYILGYPDFTFGPNKQLTRSELAAIIARLLGGGEDGPVPYKDVPDRHWAHRYIKIVTENGMFKGGPDGRFRPDDPITREELAVVMTRFLGLEDAVSAAIEPRFADVTGRWSADAIEALRRNHLVLGYTDGTFRPTANITRLEAVVMINSMLFRGPLTGIEPLFPDVASSSWGFGHVMEASVSHEAVRLEDGSEQFVRKLDDQVD